MYTHTHSYRQYHAISVPDTNLLLVSVDNTTQCEQTETPKVDKDIPYPLDTVCNLHRVASSPALKVAQCLPNQLVQVHLLTEHS